MAYDHKKIETKWQKFWSTHKIYTTPDTAPGKDNFFLLVEFPYPSGNLHVGHWYAFAVPDILARFHRMMGKNVLYPIGFDAFGLPAENAAIKNKLNPRTWTEKNIAYMTKQIQSMGTSFDWSRKISTIDPEYYKWTQWLFLQLFKKGLAYQKETAVNWCPSCKTVLANEQVVNGTCERCGSEVVQKMMLQWNIKITDYADRLIDDLADLDWPQQIKESQKNWIGRSEGAEIDFVLDFKNKEAGTTEPVVVFTTRPDTLFGATYLVLAPEHPLIAALCASQTCTNRREIEAYVKAAMRKTELERLADQKEKTGVKLEGVEAINPATGEKIPLYVADYVLGHYGTGAIMAVPAHDERDYEFAKKFDLPIKQVVAPVVTQRAGNDAVHLDEPYSDRDAVMCIVKHWDKDAYLCQQWRDFPEVKTFISGGIEMGEDIIHAGLREIVEESGYTDAKYIRQVKGFSFVEFYHQQKKKNIRARFRYLLYELQSDARQPISEEEHKKHEILWKKRNDVRDFLYLLERNAVWDAFEKGVEPVYAGAGRLVHSGEFDGMPTDEAKARIIEKYGRTKKTYKLRDWIVSRQRYWGVPIPIVHCEKCGAQPVPDTDLPVKLPEIKDYLPEGSGKSPLAKAKRWVAVTCPKCKGKATRETDTLDTFVDSSWYFLRYTDPKNKKKFADAKKMDAWMPIDLYSGGAEHTTMHLLYSRFWQKALYDLGLVKDAEPYTRRMNRSLILGPDGQKMSKSKGNVVDPDAVVRQLGADTVRMYLAFIGPYNEVSNYPWNPDGVVGIRRFLDRVWKAREFVGNDEVAELNAPLHKMIKKMGEDIALQKFNTAISQMMIFLNAVEAAASIGDGQWRTFLKVLAPFAPHIAEELWNMKKKSSVHKEHWPAYEERYLLEERVVYAIQINGKTRGEMHLATNVGEAVVEKAAREEMAARLQGKQVLRVVVVPKRLVNFVVKD